MGGAQIYRAIVAFQHMYQLLKSLYPQNVVCATCELSAFRLPGPHAHHQYFAL